MIKVEAAMYFLVCREFGEHRGSIADADDGWAGPVARPPEVRS